MNADWSTALLIAFYCCVLLSPIAAFVVWSALRAASKDDKLLDRTKTFKNLFRKLGDDK